MLEEVGEAAVPTVVLTLGVQGRDTMAEATVKDSVTSEGLVGLTIVADLGHNIEAKMDVEALRKPRTESCQVSS